MNYNTALYALGAILLGVIGIIFHDFQCSGRRCRKASRAFPTRT